MSGTADAGAGGDGVDVREAVGDGGAHGEELSKAQPFAIDAVKRKYHAAAERKAEPVRRVARL